MSVAGFHLYFVFFRDVSACALTAALKMFHDTNILLPQTP